MIGFRAETILRIWLFLQMIKNSVSIPKHALGGGNSGQNCRCGLKKKTFRDPRIVNGSEARANEYPWQAMLKLRSGFFFCGGSLIAKRWVVTAAHCLEKHLTKDILVMLGEHDKRTRDYITKPFYVSEKIVHSNYRFKTSYNNDIALVKLSSEAIFNENVVPVCLPFSLASLDSNETLTVTGWGRTSLSESPADVLQTVDVNYIPNSQCRSSKYGYKYEEITNNMICAGDNGKGSCSGDSGGPLVYENPWNRHNFLVGINSWSYKYFGCADPYYPSVYTKVENYIDWIIDKTGPAEEFCDAASINY